MALKARSYQVADCQRYHDRGATPASGEATSNPSVSFYLDLLEV